MTTEHAPPTHPLQLARPDVGERELEYVRDVLSGSALAMGPYTERFERLLAEMVGSAYGVACSSGTAGLHMLVRALGIGDGDEVITTPFSFVASANCVLFERAVPRFVDIEETTLGADPDLMEDAIGERTRAILPVHVFGNACRIEESTSLARQHGLPLIEDSCEALGTTAGGRAAGTFGAGGVFAFYPNKQITTGEGGLVVTDDPELASVLRSLRNQGRDEDGTWLRHIRLGYNYRIDELSAALGVAQLERWQELSERRRSVVTAYERALGGLDYLTLPVPRAGAEVEWFVYVVRFRQDVDRDRLIDQLRVRGVPGRPYFSPIHLQPFYREQFGYREGDFPVTERVAASTLALPFHTAMTEDQVARVAEAIDESVREQL